MQQCLAAHAGTDTAAEWSRLRAHSPAKGGASAVMARILGAGRGGGRGLVFEDLGMDVSDGRGLLLLLAFYCEGAVGEGAGVAVECRTRAHKVPQLPAHSSCGWCCRRVWHYRCPVLTSAMMLPRK